MTDPQPISDAERLLLIPGTAVPLDDDGAASTTSPPASTPTATPTYGSLTANSCAADRPTTHRRPLAPHTKTRVSCPTSSKPASPPYRCCAAAPPARPPLPSGGRRARRTVPAPPDQHRRPGDQPMSEHPAGTVVHRLTSTVAPLTHKTDTNFRDLHHSKGEPEHDQPYPQTRPAIIRDLDGEPQLNRAARCCCSGATHSATHRPTRLSASRRHPATPALRGRHRQHHTQHARRPRLLGTPRRHHPLQRRHHRPPHRHHHARRRTDHADLVVITDTDGQPSGIVDVDQLQGDATKFMYDLAGKPVTTMPSTRWWSVGTAPATRTSSATCAPPP